jgi:hypothetical protein
MSDSTERERIAEAARLVSDVAMGFETGGANPNGGLAYAGWSQVRQLLRAHSLLTAATPSPDTRLREALDSIAAEWEDDANGWILDPIMAGSAETLRRCAAQIRRALSSHTTEP